MQDFSLHGSRKGLGSIFEVIELFINKAIDNKKHRLTYCWGNCSLME